MISDLEVGQQRTLTSRDFAWLREFLLERTGIELKPGKEPMVMGRLDRRLRHHGLTSYAQYLKMLDQGDPVEVRMAVDLLTTNETYFFREPQHFAFLQELYADRRAPREPIRFWSAAASSGEEAYTLAMVLAEALPPGQAWEIVGTDISSRVIETAGRGVYPIEAAEKIPRQYLTRYCLKGREDYEGFLAIDPTLRSRVTFREANLLELPNDLGTFDVIFLRNVMIYFGMETKQRLLERLIAMIRPGGYLFVSHSETLSGMHADLRLVRPSIYQLDDGHA